MNLADLAVVAPDVAVAAGLGWWFLGPKPTAEAMAAAGVQEVKVAVRGGYSPNRIRVRAGTPVRIVFNRQESGECTSRVVFAAFGVSADLPAYTETSVQLPAMAPGEHAVACGMNMIHGVVLAEAEASASETTSGETRETRTEAAAGTAAKGRTTVEPPPPSPGSHQFTCGMTMLHRTIEVAGGAPHTSLTVPDPRGPCPPSRSSLGSWPTASSIAAGFPRSSPTAGSRPV